MPNLALPHPLLQQRVRRIKPPKKNRVQLVKLSFTETVSITSVVEVFQNYIPEPLLK
jgi:hypothetical protein